MQRLGFVNLNYGCVYKYCSPVGLYFLPFPTFYVRLRTKEIGVWPGSYLCFYAAPNSGIAAPPIMFGQCKVISGRSGNSPCCVPPSQSKYPHSFISLPDPHANTILASSKRPKWHPSLRSPSLILSRMPQDFIFRLSALAPLIHPTSRGTPQLPKILSGSRR